MSGLNFESIDRIWRFAAAINGFKFGAFGFFSKNLRCDEGFMGS